MNTTYINRTYQKPVILVVEIIIEEGMVAGSGSGSIYMGWNEPGSENAPKETPWKDGWDHGTYWDM